MIGIGSMRGVGMQKVFQVSGKRTVNRSCCIRQICLYCIQLIYGCFLSLTSFPQSIPAYISKVARKTNAYTWVGRSYELFLIIDHLTSHFDSSPKDSLFIHSFNHRPLNRRYLLLNPEKGTEENKLIYLHYRLQYRNPGKSSNLVKVHIF